MLSSVRAQIATATVSLIALLTYLFGSAPAFASNDFSKCPDSWKLTSKDQLSFEKELQEARIILGTNIATSLVSREILSDGVWRVYSSEKFERNFIQGSTLRLLGLPMRETYKIEVKNCPLPLIHSLTQQPYSTTLIQTSYQTFYQDFAKHSQQSGFSISLPDFKTQEKSMEVLNQIVVKTQRQFSSGKGIRKAFSWYNSGGKELLIKALPISPTISDRQIQKYHGPFRWIPENLDCIALSHSLKHGITREAIVSIDNWVPYGTNCKWRVVVEKINPVAPHTLFILDSVELTTPKVLIHCQSRSNPKSIFSIKKGKCPTNSIRVN